MQKEPQWSDGNSIQYSDRQGNPKCYGANWSPVNWLRAKTNWTNWTNRVLKCPEPIQIPYGIAQMIN